MMVKLQEGAWQRRSLNQGQERPAPQRLEVLRGFLRAKRPLLALCSPAK